MAKFMMETGKMESDKAKDHLLSQVDIITKETGLKTKILVKELRSILILRHMKETL